MRQVAFPLAAIAMLALAMPFSALAATLEGQKNLTLSVAPPDNTYLAGTNVTVSAPIAADLSAAAAALFVRAPIAGDALLAGGTIDVESPVAGDLRALGGRMTINTPVGGDVVAAAGDLAITEKVGTIAVAGGNVRITGGATGPVTVYGADVLLSGNFAGDVRVVASDKLSLGEGTVIHGALKYNAPQQADIPQTAQVVGGATYTGSASYLPTDKQARTFSAVGTGIFFVVKIIAALIAVGLVAGLFPRLAEQVVDRALLRSSRRFILSALLGFAIVVTTPVIILLLFVSFVGIGIALIVAALYLLFLLLSYLYAAVIAGAALARTLFKRQKMSWRDALIGMLVLTLIGTIPYVGWLVTFILCSVAGGTIASIFYNFAFNQKVADENL